MTTLLEVEKALRPYDEVTARTTGQHITLERTERLMAHINNPEKSLRVVHIAGTSGKTSTAYYTSALLTAAGYKVGLTISPYVDSMNERIQLNGRPLSQKKFCAYFGEFVETLADVPETPSRFEVLIAFAYWVFAREKVDYAVVETGMGGLEDSTNVAARRDKLCVITDIGLDHTDLLGDTLGKIAYQKAGIIHQGNTALMYSQDSEIMQVVRYWTSQQEDAELLVFEQGRLKNAYGGDFVPNMPEYQKRNWLLAFAAYKWLAIRDGMLAITATQLQKTQELQVPARMDIRNIAGKTILMDGAHNGQKMMAFWHSYSEKFPGTKPTVLFALKKGKEITDIAPLLQKYAGEIIVTSFTKAQDLPILSMPPSEIVSVLEANGVKCHVIVDQKEAYRALLEKTKDIGVITGSFFLISQLRQRRKELK